MVFDVEWVSCSARPLAGFVFGSLSIHREALFDRSHIRLKLSRVKVLCTSHFMCMHVPSHGLSR